MSTNKIFLLIITLLFFNFNTVHSEEKIKLDDEELPAIDPFQGNAAVSQTQNIDENLDENNNAGILNGMRLVGTMISNNKKFAIMSRPDGNVFKFEEDQKISSDTYVVEIFSSYVIVQDSNNKFFQVYMNNLIQEIDG